MPIDFELQYDRINHPGRPKHFDPNHYLDAVEQMICSDEIERALNMLNNMPGYYRDHVPVRALEMKERIYKQLLTVIDYAQDKDEAKDESEKIHGIPLHDQWAIEHFHPRGPLALKVVQSLNEQNKVAKIFEMAPANYWLPAALKHKDMKFTYESASINSNNKCPVETSTDDYVSEISQIFCAFETIEHLWNPDDIYHFYVKSKLDADIVMLSTPKYCLFGGLSNWENRDLGHLRNYTPKEFQSFASKHWPLMNWTFFDADMMVLLGTKPNTVLNLAT